MSQHVFFFTLQEEVVDLDDEDDENGSCVYADLCSDPGATLDMCNACGEHFHPKCAKDLFGLDLGEGCGCVEVFRSFVSH